MVLNRIESPTWYWDCLPRLQSFNLSAENLSKERKDVSSDLHPVGILSSLEWTFQMGAARGFSFVSAGDSTPDPSHPSESPELVATGK
jgi:hypothetical protein